MSDILLRVAKSVTVPWGAKVAMCSHNDGTAFKLTRTQHHRRFVETWSTLTGMNSYVAQNFANPGWFLTSAPLVATIKCLRLMWTDPRQTTKYGQWRQARVAPSTTHTPNPHTAPFTRRLECRKNILTQFFPKSSRGVLTIATDSSVRNCVLIQRQHVIQLRTR